MKTSLRFSCRASATVQRHGVIRRAATRWLSTLGILALFCSVPVMQAASVTLTWEPTSQFEDGTPLTSLAGYKLYYGTASRTYTAVRDVGAVTNATVTNLQEGVTYFLAVTACDIAGNESAFSQELAWAPPIAASVDHFTWTPISSPQAPGVPFTVAITARDTANATVTSFSGTARLSGSVAITPTNSSAFASGVWTGSVTVLSGGSNIVLAANDGAGHTGSSASFATEARLTVSSAHGTAAPAVGTNRYTYGTQLSCAMINSPVASGTTQYVCTGAAVAGNAFTPASPTNVTLTLTNNATLAWQWATNYYLTLGVTGAGALNRTSGWNRSGTNVAITATASNGYHLAGWSGDTNGCTVSGTQIVAPMDRPRAITAGFLPNSGAVDHFGWGPIASPQVAGAPFTVTVMAQDANNATVTTFGGAVSLAGLSSGDATIGAGTAAANVPMKTSYDDVRTQVIYLTNEVGRAGWVKALALNVSTVPGQTMKNWTLRMKHTPLGKFTSSSVWESAGWTTVYQKDVTVTATGWVNFVFSTPFYYNGTNNLMVDFSFNNTNHTRTGNCRYTTASAKRRLHGNVNGTTYGDPLNWSGTKPARALSTAIPNIRLQVACAVAVSPTTASGFVNGVWTGDIMVPDAVTGLVLVADDGAGHTGASSAFDVVSGQAPLQQKQDLASEAVVSIGDTDGDGMTDDQEALAGTDPYDPDEVLQMTDVRLMPGIGKAGGMVVEWTSITGKYYRVQRSTDLAAVPAFTDIATNVPAQGPVTAYTDINATDRGPYFYRIQVEP